MIRFAVLSLAVITAGHCFLSYSLAQFYTIKSPASTLITTLLLALTITFVVSTISVRMHNTTIGKAAYITSALWIGIALNIDIAAAITWIASIPLEALAPSTDLSSIFTPLAASSLLYSAYGIWNAFHPRIKTVTVNITGLPQHWKGKKIVHIADLHIGHMFGRKFLHRVVTKINSINPDIVAITGDINDGVPCEFSRKIQPMGQLKQKNTLFVTGNHDWRRLGTVIPALEKFGIKILDDRVIDINGLQVIGIACRHARTDDYAIATMLPQMNGYQAGKPTLLLRHIPVEIEEAKNLGIHLQLSGHSHSGQLFPFHIITRQIYNGYHYGLHREGHYNLHVTCGLGTWGPPMRTAGFSEITVITIT